MIRDSTDALENRPPERCFSALGESFSSWLSWIPAPNFFLLRACFPDAKKLRTDFVATFSDFANKRLRDLQKRLVVLPHETSRSRRRISFRHLGRVRGRFSTSLIRNRKRAIRPMTISGRKSPTRIADWRMRIRPQRRSGSRRKTKSHTTISGRSRSRRRSTSG